MKKVTGEMMMRNAKYSNPKLSNQNVGAGWLCSVMGIFILGMSSRLFIPVWQAMTGPRTGSSGTTIGMGMGIGMPFFVIGIGLLLLGWFLVLNRKSKMYSLLFVICTILVTGIFSKLVWYTSALPHRSPLTQAIDSYSTYSVDELSRELQKEIKYYENTKFVAFLVGSSRIKIQAIMRLLTDKYPARAKDVLGKISTTSNDGKIRELARNSLLWIK